MARYDVVVIGTGPVGLAAAVALAREGFATAVCGPQWPPAGGRLETRTAAIFGGGIPMLENLGVWSALEKVATPIRAIRIVDDMGGLLRAPEVLFAATDIGEEALGYNIPNAAAVAALEDACRKTGLGVTRIETAGVQDIAVAAGEVAVRTTEGIVLKGNLVVGADGRNSPSRAAAGIEVESWTYDQSALVCTFAHGRPHDGISTELHRPSGPFTVVPLPGRTSSLVWVERRQEAERLLGLAEGAFRALMEERLAGLLGLIGEIGPRATFPLSGLSAKRMGQNRIALAGEACHVIPPIGAQGLNLGLRDVAALTECLAEGRRAGSDVGSDDVLANYERARRSDITMRTTGVDLLNRSLLTEIAPLHLARGAMLQLLSVVPALRGLLIKQGLAPPGEPPPLMRRQPS